MKSEECLQSETLTTERERENKSVTECKKVDILFQQTFWLLLAALLLDELALMGPGEPCNQMYFAFPPPFLFSPLQTKFKKVLHAQKYKQKERASVTEREGKPLQPADEPLRRPTTQDVNEYMVTSQNSLEPSLSR